jgi:hemoglobin
VDSVTFGSRIDSIHSAAQRAQRAQWRHRREHRGRQTMTGKEEGHASTDRSIVVIIGVTNTPARAQGNATKSLYDRLGGVYSIATVVDDFIERLLVNDTLNANPAIKASRERVPKAGLKFHVTTLVCQVTGGPCKYTGRTMKESHAKLNITEAQWNAMVADFRKTLDKFKVPQAEQQELIGLWRRRSPISSRPVRNAIQCGARRATDSGKTRRR